MTTTRTCCMPLLATALILRVSTRLFTRNRQCTGTPVNLVTKVPRGCKLAVHLVRPGLGLFGLFWCNAFARHCTDLAQQCRRVEVQVARSKLVAAALDHFAKPALAPSAGGLQRSRRSRQRS